MSHNHEQVLKKYCRIFNITRWPFRKLKSLDKLVSTVSSIEDEHSLNARFAVAQGLEHKKLEMRLMPSIEVSLNDIACPVLTSSESWKAHSDISKKPNNKNSSTATSNGSARPPTSLSTRSAAQCEKKSLHFYLSCFGCKMNNFLYRNGRGEGKEDEKRKNRRASLPRRGLSLSSLRFASLPFSRSFTHHG